MITYQFLSPEVITDQHVAEINALLPQLSASATPFRTHDLVVMVQYSLLLVARNEFDGTIKGMATLVPVYKFTSTVGLIEDVVVDETLRGNRVGETLVQTLIDEADRSGLYQLELTSKPERVAANQLYQKLGFKLRETNLYRMAL
jgi:N-acetylglutamate synthase-like GNAT family acetyltransferase